MSPARGTRIRALEGAARAIWDERADLRPHFESIDSLGFWRWLMVEGTQEYPVLLDHLPIASQELRDRVTSGDLRIYMLGSANDAGSILQHLVIGGWDPGLGGRLLDYGCGSGRLLRLAAPFARTCELHGVDVDADAIAWCQSHLDFAHFRTILPRPPTDFPTAHFDAVYSFSVFTHLPEPLHRAWLEELHRITRPGGVLVLTTHGRRATARWAAGEIDAVLTVPTPAELRAALPRLAETGYLYFSLPIRYDALPAADRDADVYGMTFIDLRYIRERWLDLFELVHVTEAPQDWQDYVVLRRR